MTNRVRVLAWLWVAAAAVGGAAGMAATYREPELLRISAFADIYTAAGFSDNVMITALLVLPLVGAIGAAAIILFSRGTERAAAMFAVCLVATYFFMSGAALGLPVAWLRNLTASVSMVLLTGFLVVFPSATIRPRWAVIAPALTVALVVLRPDLAAATRAAMSTPLSVEDRGLVGVGLGVILAIAFASQVVRYRSISSTTERYQARWVLAALSLMLVPPATILLLFAGGLSDSPAVGYLVLVSAVGSLAFPAAVAVATFRYHLYEIDRIISRTITYGLVAVVVTAVYVGMVIALPALAGTSSGAYVAGATLAATAAFNPTRRRIQKAVDRRFNRTRYDSEREIEALSSRVGVVVDVADIEQEMTGVLLRTVQPASVSWWFSQ